MSDKRLSAQNLAALSHLLDEALELAEEARAVWLAGLVEPFPGAKAALSKMLAKEASGEVEGLLDTLPKLSLSQPEVDVQSGVPPEARIGNYRLVCELGHGGMGQVWLAEQTEPVRRTVAIKLIRAGMYDESVVQRFRSERQSLAIMDHPAIAKVFDAGSTPQGQPYFVMEYVPGLPITEYCDQKKLKIRERLELFIQACEGVQHAHQKAIIHRDLKPANILIVEVDGKPVPRIIDFGLAKPATPRVTDEAHYTQLGQFIGTPGYMSPEQVDPNIRDIDTRTDVYALGVVLYVLLTGLQPWETKQRRQPPLDEWLRRLREEEPPSLCAKVSADRESAWMSAAARSTEPKQLISLLRGDLESITMKALERQRDRRYGTLSELAADLRRYLNNEAVLARPATAAYQIRKFIGRHRVGIAAAGVLILTLAGGLAATSYEAAVASAQRDAALETQLRLVTQTAADRLKDGDIPTALGIILEVLPHQGLKGTNTPQALSVFQEARAADAQILAFTGHTDVLTSAAFSPNGRNIVSASYDQTARLWDAASGRETLLLRGHTAGLNFAVLSPDSRYVVTAARDKTARIWDAATGREVRSLIGHTSGVWSAAFSPDGRYIVTASGDKTARIWDAATGQQIRVLGGHVDSVHSAAFSPDARHIVTASWDKTARVWDAGTGRQIILLEGHTDRVWCAAYSPDGRHLVTASDDKTGRIWDAATGQQTALLSGHTSRVLSAEYSPDGRRVVTASEDATVRVWDAATGQQLVLLSGYTGRLNHAAFAPDGRRIVVASYDNTARIWNAASGQELMQLSGHSDRVFAAAFSPDGKRIVTASWDKSARVWNATTGEQILLLSGHSNLVVSSAFSPDGGRIVTGSGDTTARVWNAATGQPITILKGHTGRVWSAAFSPDGRRVVTASDDKTARIWDAETGRELLQLDGHKERVLNAAYSPDGQRIVTTSTDKTTRVWNAADGRQLMLLSGHEDVVESAAFSPDGKRIVTASDDKTARVWDAATGLQILILSGHSNIVGSAAFSPDGRRIVTASFDRTARIWDSATGQQMKVLSGHADLVETALFSPDGQYVVTASDDKTARLWDARTPPLEAQISWATAAQFDPLQSSERSQLGLPAPNGARQWPADQSACDKSAAAPYDPNRRAPGVTAALIDADMAIAACVTSKGNSKNSPRFLYQHGRALMAGGNFPAARRDFEDALAAGYRTARIDLAMLLSKPEGGMLDISRAISLYEQAWNDGVTIAAFELGNVYEHGVDPASGKSEYSLAPDNARAWPWYQKAADAGEPNALARLAERDDSAALDEEDPGKKSSYLVESFKYYATASERAKNEDWPDSTWRNWRYRRANLARLLAREGVMDQVAEVYSAVRQKWPSHSPTLWERIEAKLPRLSRSTPARQ